MERLARRVGELPETVAALVAGELSLDQASATSCSTNADRTGVEFSMSETFDRVRHRGRARTDPTDADRFIEIYLGEWSTAVRLIDGVPAMLARLQAEGTASCWSPTPTMPPWSTAISGP